MRVDAGGRARVRAALGGTALAALVLGSLTVPAHAADPAPTAVECPSIVPKADITDGLIGEGETVVKGTTPEPFQVEVLGTIVDGYSPGHDIIMVKLSDLPGHSVIAPAGGGWEGISGSPVYVDGKLLGSVSFGFTTAPSPLAGLTPAADMADLLTLPAKTAATSRLTASKTVVRKVSLSSSRLRAFAAQAGVATPSGSLTAFRTPFAVSGLGGARLQSLRSDLTKAGRASSVYAAGRAPAVVAGAPTDRPVAGGNFADMISFGDISAGGLGTTTYVCKNQVLAFGHPMDQAGATSYGANDASAITIVKDDTFGAYKQIGSFGPSFGTVDQDRTAGVRGDLTRSPATVPVTTYIADDDTGKTRTGVTQVAATDYLTIVALYAAFANYDTTFDEVGGGRTTATWAITGTRAGGRPFYVARANKFADPCDATGDPAFDLADALDTLLNGSSEKVTITGVTFKSAIGTDYKALNLRKVEVSVNGGKYTVPKMLKLKAGDKLSVRNTVTPYQSTTPSTSITKLTVPTSARGSYGYLSVAGGQTLAGDDIGDDSSCLLDDGGCDDLAPTSLDTVIKGLTSPPRNDDLVVSLTKNDSDGDPVSIGKATVRQAEVISGRKTIAVTVAR